jgi:uncharacterized membrane protein YhaH (DUF805 family)
MQPATASDLVTFFFRPVGRIGRLEYALGLGTIVSIETAVVAYVYGRDDIDPGIAFLITMIALPTVVAELVVVAKRCHDIGLPGLFVVLIFVPLLGLLWLLLLAGMPGTPGLNGYGAPPGPHPD